MRHALLWPFVFTVLIHAARPAAAQTPATTVEELRGLAPVGSLITVTDNEGRRTTGRLREIGAGRLVVEKGSTLPQRRSFLVDQVATIKKTDSRANGYWIGFAIGAVPGVMFGTLLNRLCYNESPSHCPGAIFLYGGLSGLAGGGIGWAIDDAVNAGPVLYSRTAGQSTMTFRPLYLPARGEIGASLRLTF